jgi:hypothetical protein
MFWKLLTEQRSKVRSNHGQCICSGLSAISVELKVEPSQQAQEYFAGEINRRKAIYEAAQQSCPSINRKTALLMLTTITMWKMPV